MDFPSITLLGGNLTYLNLNETVIVTDQAAFDQFGISLFRDDYVIIELYAHINVAALGMRYTNIEFRKLMTIQGTMHYPNNSYRIHFHDILFVPLAGMGKFQDPPPVVLNQTIFQGTPTELYMNLFVSLYNSAPVTIDNMGPLNMTLFVSFSCPRA